MEVSIENKLQKSNGSKHVVTKNEESILKEAGKNEFGLIKNEIKPSEDNSIEYDENSNKKIVSKKCKLYQFVGRTLFIFLDKYSNPLFIIGPHWPIFICLSVIISLIMLLIYYKFWAVFGFYTKLFGEILYWTFIISYTYTSLINPGYPRNTIGRTFGIPKNEYYFCEYCGFYLRKYSYGAHCDICQICIEKYDHHCFWTGHCIGKNNKITFEVFLISLFCLILYFCFTFYKGLSKSFNIL